jgi:hypothetical protein
MKAVQWHRGQYIRPDGGDALLEIDTLVDIPNALVHGAHGLRQAAPVHFG